MTQTAVLSWLDVLELRRHQLDSKGICFINLSIRERERPSDLGADAAAWDTLGGAAAEAKTRTGHDKRH